MGSLLLYDSCEDLSRKFFSLKTSRDIATLLDVKYNHLVYYLYKIPDNQRYTNFELLKKSTSEQKKVRVISVPITPLKILQRKLSQVLYSIYKTKSCVHGFAPAKSILTNARVHKRKKWVLNIDLQDFFPSINFGRVRGMFIAFPYKCDPKVATVLAQICCYNNYIPQGAPTSPVISNMICAKMDSQLTSLAHKYRCFYTRYADDITFSTTFDQFPEQIASITTLESKREVVLGKELISIIEANGFRVNYRKTRLQNSKSHQEVTGLTVNQFPNINRKYIRQIRAMLHAWDEYKIEAAEKQYLEKYATIKQRYSEKSVPSFKQVLRGKIDFLGMVRGKEDPKYQKFIAWYRKLSKRDSIKS